MSDTEYTPSRDEAQYQADVTSVGDIIGTVPIEDDADNPYDAARRILRSEWLAAHDAELTERVRAEALEGYERIRALYPPNGWERFGTHADDGVPVIFSDELGEDDLPKWERIDVERVRAEQREADAHIAETRYFGGGNIGSANRWGAKQAAVAIREAGKNA